MFRSKFIIQILFRSFNFCNQTFLRYMSHFKNNFMVNRSLSKFLIKTVSKIREKWVSKLCGTPVPGNTAKALANAVPALTVMDWYASTTWTCAVNALGSMPRILDSRSWINCKQYVILLSKINYSWNHQLPIFVNLAILLYF
jgi:hypothetical protein